MILAPASKKQEIFLNSDATITLAGGAAGSGKALRHGEKVHTPNGWINIEDCEVGMVISSPSSGTQLVTGVYPQGEVDIYRVTFQDGSFVDTCGEHLWQYHEARGRGAVKVNNTLHLKSRLEKGFRPIVPLTKPVSFSYLSSELPVGPYTLGVLLGDGSITTKSVSFSSNDIEIVDSVRAEGYSVNRWCEDSGNTPQYGILEIQSSLRELMLLGANSQTKFIPNIYKIASVEDKFKLVNGLMDTDGYVDSKGSTEYCTVSRRLAHDLADILRSLGFTVKITEKKTSFTYRGVKKQGLTAYVLYIRGRLQNKLFTLKRKQERTKEKNVGNRIISIEHVGKDLATCISVSGEDKLFITTNYIVTHNTYTSLLIALKFMQHPRATGVIFRRTSKMITSPGSIWHEAVNMYTTIYKTGLKIRHRENEIVFPNGALLKFSHMQHASNMYDHKGGQYSLVIFDEATDFTEEMIVYLLSRMRNAYVDYSPQMFLMTNPDYNSFLREWIQDFYLDPITGIPKEELAGVKRYFFRQGNQMIWYNSLKEAESIHGSGPESGISSFAFIPATCRDNPPLLKAQPDYLSRLMSLPRVEMERLLLGSWFARPEASGLFKREWCQLVDYPNGRATQRVRAWDLAFTKPSEQYPNPDWTRGVLISKDKSNVYTVEDVVSIRDRTHEVERLIFDTAVRDGQGVIISLPMDPAAAAGAYAKDLQRKLSEMGFIVRLTKPVKSKVTRFAPFGSIAQAGFVNIVKADWNKGFFDELEIFDGAKDKKDD
jgi:predicted phage terminase large subunit-like protein